MEKLRIIKFYKMSPVEEFYQANTDELKYHFKLKRKKRKS